MASCSQSYLELKSIELKEQTLNVNINVGLETDHTYARPLTCTGAWSGGILPPPTHPAVSYLAWVYCACFEIASKKEHLQS